MFKKEFYDMRLRTFVILAIGIGLFFVLAPFQDVTIEMLKQYSQIQNMPKFLEKLLPKSFIENLSDWSFYIFSQWFGKNLGQMVPILAIIMAFPLFARENENGTIEFLLARQSRKKVFLAKSILGLLTVLGQMLVFSLLPAIYSFFANENLKYSYLLAFLVHTVVGAIFWFMVALILSVMSADQVKPILISFGLLAATTAVGMIRYFKFLNTYTYVLGSKIFQSGRIDLNMTIALFISSIILFGLSYIVFLKKEF